VPGRRLLESNSWRLMAEAIDGRGRVKEGESRGGVKTLTRHLYSEAGRLDVAGITGSMAGLSGAG
jgi:hypothetical protein